MAGIADMLIGGYNSGHALAKDRRAEADKSALAGLISQGYATGTPDYAQIAAVSPEAAINAQDAFADLDEQKAKQFVQTAQVFTQVMTPEQRAQAWPGIRAELSKRIPQAQYPEQWDEALLPQAQKLAALIGGGEQAEQYTLTPGSARYDASGRLIAERPQAPPKPDYIFQTDAEGNGYWLPKPTGTAGAPAPTTGGGAQVMDSAYQGGLGFDPLRDAVEFHESRGNPDAVSPAGAVGRMQTMPGTLQDPGFGIAPARDQSDAERTRVGNEYLQAMLQKYGDPMLALAAYNWGPGNVDQALQRSGGDPRAVLASAPQETQQYVQNVMASAGGQGGPTAPQAAPGGAIPIPGFRGAPKGRDAPSGYRYGADGQSLEPIPGGPADPSVERPLTPTQRAAQQKIQLRARKEQQMLSANEAAVDQTVRLIDGILKSGDLEGVTGMGALLSKIPGTDYADVAAKLDTLKGRSAFGALQQMRANSPTGGALGQVSERELYLLQNAETQLQNSQSPESLAQALRDYKATLLDSKRRMRQGVSEFYSEQAPQAESGGWAIEVAD